MATTDRCDEIIRLIDRVLAEVDAVSGPVPASTVTRTTARSSSPPAYPWAAA